MAEHDGLVCWVVRRQRLRGLPFEDAVHEGRIGLWRAIQGYDPGRGTRLSTYAVVAIKRSVWEAVRSYQESCSGFAELPEVLDPSEPLDESLAILEAREELSALIAGLPRRLGEIVVRHHGLKGHFPESFTSIGLSLGVSRQRVHYLHKQALILLAQPDRSLRLRRFFERNTRRDYQAALARKHHQARQDRRAK
jgi:RNA polymerase sigma factor (sigma-70 family)